MKTVHLITVGKLKDKNLEQIENNFYKRIKSLKLLIHELKSSSENKEAEGQLILKKLNDLSSSFVCGLTERGKSFDSPSFSRFLYQELEKNSSLCFVIAGAEGFSDEVIKKFNIELSLSAMTFPHKLARLLFIEQFYRAITIHENHPYHN